MNDFKHDITYYYDDEFGTFNYSTSHPMKPLRVAITDDLVGHYGLKKYMNCIVRFHDYRRIKLLFKRISKE